MNENGLLDQVVARNGDYAFTRRELAAAFAAVESPKGWKYPINAVVALHTQREKMAVLEAVNFFAGGGATLTAVRGRNKYRVRAPGYYALIGA